MISIVCVYNDEKALNSCLSESLKGQTVNFDFIALDNREGKFKSAADALNFGSKQAKGKYIMFAHQDIVLSSKQFLEQAENMLDSLVNLGVAGVAGRTENVKGVITNIKHGIPPRLAGSVQIENPKKVQTIDECLAIIPRQVFDVLQFDEKVCDSWHLYVVDYCLSVKKRGFDVYVLPMHIYHRSIGYKSRSKLQMFLGLETYSEDYYLCMEKLLKKHKDYYGRIYTTCGNWNTSYPVGLQRVLKLPREILIGLFKK